jgi:uncharacterized protein
VVCNSRETKDFIRHKRGNDSSGHDWWHIHRVWQNAVPIEQMEKAWLKGKSKNADLHVVNLAALLHGAEILR